MITAPEVLEAQKMVEQDNLDVRTITMGISLLDCASSDINETCDKIYKKITTLAKDLVKTGESISRRLAFLSFTNVSVSRRYHSLEQHAARRPTTM